MSFELTSYCIRSEIAKILSEKQQQDYCDTYSQVKFEENVITKRGTIVFNGNRAEINYSIYDLQLPMEKFSEKVLKPTVSKLIGSENA